MKNYVIKILHLINKENFKSLFFALKNESVSDIWNNSKKYIKNTISENTRNNSIKHFIEVVSSKSATSTKEVIVFVSHEATITGAPLIVLNLAKHLLQDHNILPIFFCLEGGDLVVEFDKIAPTYVFRNSNNKASLHNQTKQIINKLKSLTDISKAVVNSAESITILEPLIQSGIKKITFLLHETGSFYKKNAWLDINKYAETIIFPSQFVKKHAFENTYFDVEKVFVKGQGLLKPELLLLNKENEKQKLRQLLKLPTGSKIVLGCGQLIARKGFDMFTFAAISVCNILNNVYFVWLGEATYNDYQKWVNIDIAIAKKTDKIIFAGQVEDTTTYFAGADLFFLSSRGDPFPCVVQEAMACKMPVIAFEDAGGVNELVDDTNGSIVPYGDINKITDKIIDLIQDRELELKGSNALKKIKKQHSFKKYSNYIHNYLKND